MPSADQMDTEEYDKFYNEFGQVIKREGITLTGATRTRLQMLLRYKTTKSDGKCVSLQDYVRNMQADQEDIYYITSDNLSTLLNSPHLEQSQG